MSKVKVAEIVEEVEVVEVAEVSVAEQIVNTVASLDMNKSTKIKRLYDLGVPISEISKLLGIRYNFSYNVISNYCMMNGVDIVKANKVSKKDLIIEMFAAGKNSKEIGMELKSNLNYVYKVINEYKESIEEK